MYVLLIPALLPFLLLGTLIGLSWLEDRLLPARTDQAPAPADRALRAEPAAPRPDAGPRRAA
ncbi:hypothetical protein ACFQLX_14860 [Streptomyces polyrhachis]|uniref:Uncharacterized protein n=1 Tax=Streptomyces polyrhachis TaxID=1282885 RepID=A0ABW2GJW2_9ACTN